MLSTIIDKESKNNSPDRIIVLCKGPGKNTMTTAGLIDNRLFTGENKLHAIQDITGLWALSYDAGLVPGPLRQKFTGFNKLYKFIEDYFKRRNIEIKEVHNATAAS